MEADAEDLQRLSVQEEALIRIEPHETDAERGFIPIDGTPPDPHGRNGPIKGGSIHGPQLRVRDLHLLQHGGIRSRRNADPPGAALPDPVTLGIIKRRLQLDGHRIGGIVAQCGPDGHGCLIRSDGRRCDEGSPKSDVDRMGPYQPDVSVDSRTGIPPGIRLFRIIHPDDQYILLRPIIQTGRQVIPERDITIRPISEQMTVEPHPALLVNAVEIDKEAFVTITLRNGKTLPVPSDAARKRPASGSRRMVGRKVALDTPVMRQVQFPPRRIVEIRIGEIAVGIQGKPPIGRKIRPLPDLRTVLAGKTGPRQQGKQAPSHIPTIWY